MCHVAIDGRFLWANDRYYELAGRPASEHVRPLAFLDVYHEDDKATAVQLWEDLIKGKEHMAVELRLKRMYSPPVGEPEPAQIQVLAFPYRDETGMIKSIMACTTDISKLKWAQNVQTRLAAEAKEAKRQQESFIDVVSHEMRNPLSAIVHCADAISSALEEYEEKVADIPKSAINMINDNIQSAKTILQCANHQKRIIDDVLTLSKLDSMLLSITPVSTQPTSLIHSIGNIFEMEMRNNRITYHVEPDISLKKFNIDHLYFDPSRVTQIFINLLTNAIKFVKSSEKPTISIHFGVCTSEPRAFFPETMFWATERKQDVDVLNSPEWGTGEEIYLAFSVSDSGIGLREKEIHKIFEKFRQANVKTHVKYGGSGLGLFISKELTEKQGGEIGVSSISGQGSTFGFYIKSRRVEKPSPVATSLPMRLNALPNLIPKQIHVLLVEDNLINQQVLSKQLKRAGCIVKVGNHGLEALEILKKERFDIVLMDLEMPVLDGLGAIRQIREKEASGKGLLESSQHAEVTTHTHLPIIAVTANVRKEQIDTAIAAGAVSPLHSEFKSMSISLTFSRIVSCANLSRRRNLFS